MAFPTIPTAAANTLLATPTTTASTTHTFPNLTTLAPQAGDLLIAICVQYSGTSGGSPNDQFSSWGAGFTETLDDETTTANDLALGVAHKIATGSESSTFTVTSAFAARSVNFLMRIPAATWHGTTIPEVLAAVRAVNSVPDPGSFDPANWAAEDTLWIAVYGHSETSTTGSPPIITASPTNYSGDLIVARNADAVGHITAGVGFRQLNATAEDAGTWTVSNATRGNGLATLIAVRPAAAVPIQKTITEATTTAAAQTLSVVKPLIKTVTQASAVNTAQSVSFFRQISRTLTPAVGVNSAGHILNSSERNIAQTLIYAISGSQSRTLGVATTVAAAQSLTFTKTIRKTLGVATNANTAQTLSVVKPILKSITTASSVSTAQTVTKTKNVTLGTASTANTSIQARATVRLGVATVSTSAQALTLTKTILVTIGAASTTNSAQAVTYTLIHFRTIGAASALNAAQTLDVDKKTTITRANESETAGALRIPKLAAATEVDIAQPASESQAVTLSAASTANSAQSLTFTKVIRKTLGAAAETDTAQAQHTTVHLGIVIATQDAEALSISKTIRVTIGFASTTNSAQTLSITHVHFRSITPGTVANSAQTLTANKFKSLTVATVTNSAQTLSITKPILKAITQASVTDAAQTQNLYKPKSLTAGTVTDSSITLTKHYVVNLNTVTESDTSQHVVTSAPQHVDIGFATAINSARTLSVVKPIVKSIFQAETVDEAQTLTSTKVIHKSLTEASTTNEAQVLTALKPIVKTLSEAVATSTSEPLTIEGHAHNVFIVAAEEVETSLIAFDQIDKALTISLPRKLVPF